MYMGGAGRMEDCMVRDERTGGAGRERGAEERGRRERGRE